MSSKLLLFSLGVIAFSYCPYLPSQAWLLCLLPLFGGAYRWPVLWNAFALALGIGWGLIVGHGLVAQQLDEYFMGRDLLVTGRISGLPERDDKRLRFGFRVETLSQVNGTLLAPESFPSYLQLSWYLPRTSSTGFASDALPLLSVGEQWQLRVRLKRPRGFVNPAGFDYQAWLLRKGFGATGYVVSHRHNQRLTVSPPSRYGNDWIHQQRYRLQQWVLQHSQSPERGILVALLIGDGALVESAQWQRMQKTGTSHLIAISGLHVGFLALFGYYFGLLLGKLVNLCWRPCPSLVVAWLCGLACAGFYAALAGFNIPTVRTLIMLGLFYLACLARRTLRISDIFCWALALVLVIDPLAAYDMGFWLSFGAVALLLLAFSGRRETKQSYQPWMGFSFKETLLGFIRSQWVMFVGLLLPLSLLISSVSLVAPLANAIAIPTITFLVVPLLLLGAALGNAGGRLSEWLLGSAATLMEWLAYFLDGLLVMAGEWASPVWVVPSHLLPLMVLATAVLLLPRGLFPRALGVAGGGLVALLVFVAPKPAIEDLVVTLLDVGQGTAVVVQVGPRTLVYDTGPQYTHRFDAGSAIVAPYLHAQGIRQIDYLVVSHGDADHAGGLEGLLANVKVGQRLEGEPQRSAAAGQVLDCHDYPPWQWEAVSFQFLPVPPRLRNNANNHSCVLVIRYGEDVILLPGDIEARVEQALLASGQVPQNLTLLAAAHHGSRSSSSISWVQHTRPAHVVYSAGYRNPHGHPHPRVQAAYQAVGSNTYSTASSGALVFRWGQGRLLSVEAYREQARRYWHDP